MVVRLAGALAAAAPALGSADAVAEQLLVALGPVEVPENPLAPRTEYLRRRERLLGALERDVRQQERDLQARELELRAREEAVEAREEAVRAEEHRQFLARSPWAEATLRPVSPAKAPPATSPASTTFWTPATSTTAAEELEPGASAPTSPPDPSRHTRADAPERVRCRNCRALIEGDRRYCPQCGRNPRL